MFNRTIRLSPGIFINKSGSLNKLPELLNEFEIQHPVILTDPIVLKVIPKYLPTDFLTQYPIKLFNGSCTFAEIQRLTDQLADFDGIIAFGGGQLMDTAKVVSDRLGNVLIDIQTVPSNCAAFTTKSIVYSETHEMIASVREKKPVDVVVLEPELLQNAPLEYLRSGIGDTLAKYYEIRRRLIDDKLEDNSALIKEIRSYYPQVGLPLSLSALGVTKEDQLNSLAEYMAQPDNVRMQSIFPGISSADIRQALLKLI